MDIQELGFHWWVNLLEYAMSFVDTWINKLTAANLLVVLRTKKFQTVTIWSHLILKVYSQMHL